MGTDADYPIHRAIAETSYALAGDLALDAITVKRILNRLLFRKVPKEERPDVLQDLAFLALQDRPPTPGLLYFAFDFYIRDWLKSRRYRQHNSLDVVIGDDEGDGTPLIEMLSDESKLIDEFVCDLMWAKEVLAQIPVEVIQIANKRVHGMPLTAAERQRLSRWKRSHGLLLNSKGD